MSCPFAVLGLSPNASRDQVRKAFHELARKYHPDKAGTVSGERMKKINAAYQDALRIVEGGHRDFTASYKTHKSQAKSSHYGSTKSGDEFRFEPASFASTSRTAKHSEDYPTSKYGGSRNEKTTSYSDNYGYEGSSKSYSSHSKGGDSQAYWSTRYTNDVRSATYGASSGYGGYSSTRDPMPKGSNYGWVNDAKERKIKKARDIEAEFGLQSRRLERLDKHSSRDREDYNRLMSHLKSIEKRLEAAVMDVEDFQDWIDEGKEMGYF